VTEAANHFRATVRKREDPGPALIEGLPVKRRPKAARRADDAYLTGDTTPIRSLLARDGARIRALGGVWDPACGAGDMVKVIRAEGIPCSASDLVDRRCPDSWQADFFSCMRASNPAIITNPPFNLINAKGRGLWLKHSLAMPGWRYMALLLSWNWPAGRINGMGALLDLQPFSHVYLMRFRIDFTGEGDPPNQHAWFVWDRDDPRSYDGRHPEPSFRFLDPADDRQAEIDLTPTTGDPS
jgi:hypothetical protein